MTDREALQALLKRFDLKPSDEDAAYIVLEAKRGGVQGYEGFQAQFEFTADGKFQQLRIWE